MDEDPAVRDRIIADSESLERLCTDLETTVGFCRYEDLQELSRGLQAAHRTVGVQMALQIYNSHIRPALEALKLMRFDEQRLRNNLTTIFNQVPPSGMPDRFEADGQLARMCETLRRAAPLTVILWSVALDPWEWTTLPPDAFYGLVESTRSLAAGTSYDGNVPDDLMIVAWAMVSRGRREYSTTEFYQCGG